MNITSTDIWQVLDLDPTVDIAAIRRAYARRLKRTHPEDDPDGFQRLRAAYEAALVQARRPAPPWATPEAKDDAGPPVMPERGAGLAQAPPANAAAGRALAQAIVSALASAGQGAAIDTLDSVLRHPAFQSLTAREAFRETLLEALGQLDEVPGALGVALVERFDWWDVADERFGDYEGVLESLWLAWEAHETLEAMRAEAGDWRSWAFDRDALAATLLLGEYRPKWFRWLAWDYDLKQAIGRDLAALSPFADGVLAVWLDPQTLHWWRTRIGRRRSARVRLIHWLASRYWLYAAGAGVGAWWADVDLPRWALALLIVTAMLGLLVDLSRPAILPFIRLLGRSAGLRRGLRALLLVAGFILTFVLPARWAGVGPAAVFVALVTLLRDEQEFSVYLSTTLAVAFGLGIAARLAGWTQIPFDWAILAGLTAAWAAVAWRRRRVAAVK